LIPRFGGSSLGGKGEGLALIDELLGRPAGSAGRPASSPSSGARLHEVALRGASLREAVPGLRIDAPRTAIICAEYFEEFLRSGDLREAVSAAYAKGGGGYAELRRRFLDTPLPPRAVGALADFMPEAGKPLIARSSSLLEDSEGEPFSGVYESYAIPNDHPHPGARLTQLVDAVRLVYASLYSPDAIAYRAAVASQPRKPSVVRAPTFRSGESMAVVVQELVGSRRGRWYYPALSGTAESLNYYPISYAKPEDGLCVAALGLGSYVVEGGAAHRFCPRYPALNAVPPEFAGQGSQRSFRALDMELPNPDLIQGESAALAELELSEAEGTDALAIAASTWDREDGRLVPGTARSGTRIVDLAPILKYDALPFAEAIMYALEAAQDSTGGPVEIEYALDKAFPGGPDTLFLLQLKRLRRSGGSSIDLEGLDAEGCLVFSERAMGEGSIGGIRDIVWIDPARFDRSRSRDAAAEVAALDRELAALGRHYALIGPGRWGSRDPWLGLPVTYPQIANAKAIVETEMPGFAVDFSFGSHFLRNVAGRGIGYLAVPSRGKSVVDWERLAGLPREKDLEFCSLSRSGTEIEILMDGKLGRALIRERAG
jgi:hypothetical protein